MKKISSSDEERFSNLLEDIRFLIDMLERLLDTPMPPVAQPSPVSLEYGKFPSSGRGAAPAASFTEGRVRMIRQYLAQRRMRNKHFRDNLFSDPAWDMLLALYAAHHEGADVSVSGLCIAAAVPPATALRWIKMMEGAGYFQRYQDESHGRRVFIRLSKDARLRMNRYFNSFAYTPIVPQDGVTLAHKLVTNSKAVHGHPA